MFLVVLSACATAPITGRHQLILVSPAQEAEMGVSAYKEVLSQSTVSRDAKTNELVERVGRRLAAVADRPDFQWEFKVIQDDKTVNAFCLPGGKVAVYTGILPVTQSEAGLAVVMGHEIGHAIARHGGERVSTALLAQVGEAGVVAALGSKDPETNKLVVGAYGVGAAVGVLLPFSRSQESEADHIGLILMAKAGYDPAEAVAFWQRMSALKGGKGSGLERFLSTHPSDEKRIGQIREWLPEAERARRY